MAEQAARVVSQVLEASLEHGRRELFDEMLDLPARHYELQLRLPPVLPPELEQLRTAIRTDDQERFDELINSAVAAVDTPTTRAGLVRKLLSLMDTAHLHSCAAATAVFDLSRPESPFLEAALIEGLAVSAGATTTPSGLLVAAR